MMTDDWIHFGAIVYLRLMYGLSLQEAEATPVRPHMTPRPGQGLSLFFFIKLC